MSVGLRPRPHDVENASSAVKEIQFLSAPIQLERRCQLRLAIPRVADAVHNEILTRRKRHVGKSITVSLAALGKRVSVQRNGFRAGVVKLDVIAVKFAFIVRHTQRFADIQRGQRVGANRLGERVGIGRVGASRRGTGKLPEFPAFRVASAGDIGIERKRRHSVLHQSGGIVERDCLALTQTEVRVTDTRLLRHGIRAENHQILSRTQRGSLRKEPFGTVIGIAQCAAV